VVGDPPRDVWWWMRSGDAIGCRAASRHATHPPAPDDAARPHATASDAQEGELRLSLVAPPLCRGSGTVLRAWCLIRGKETAPRWRPRAPQACGRHARHHGAEMAPR